MANMIDYNEKVLQIKNLKKYFHVGSGKRKLTVPAVDNVNIDVFKREVFGVVGESGSGKTTLGRTVIKLYQPTDGSVTLNGVTISVGIQGYLESIKAIKAKLNEDILRLNPSKIKAIDLKKEADFEIQNLKNEKVAILKDKAVELISITKLFDQYRADQYQIKALMNIELQKVEFDFNLKVIEAKRSLQNEALLKYKNEVKIAAAKLAHKLSGLKDSAALEQATINERSAALRAQHVEFLASLEKIYLPQIEETKSRISTKAQVQERIQGFEKEKNKLVLSIKAKFQAQLKELKQPNKSVFNKDLAKFNAKYTKLLAAVDKKIAQIKTQLTSTLASLPKTQPVEKDATMAQTISKLKVEASVKIKELQGKIAEAKRINDSKDTLKESQKMQMIFQDPISSLNPRMTVREIIGEGLTIQGKTSKAEIERKVAEVLKIVGLSPEYASRYPHEFSGGQRQRIGVARAVIMDPNVIIADEPISALDVSIRAQVINLLFNLRETLGLTILFIAHDLSVVRFFCDRIAVMYNGKVVESAPSEELFNNPKHPYTISLLSAIPQPDPDYEKNRQRIHYDPRVHRYDAKDIPTLKEVSPNHFVYANNAEFALMKETNPLVKEKTNKEGK
jgi:oligopeptide transport system ATP-binding protein